LPFKTEEVMRIKTEIHEFPPIPYAWPKPMPRGMPYLLDLFESKKGLCFVPRASGLGQQEIKTGGASWTLVQGMTNRVFDFGRR
jgi:hypothetical protein